MTTNNSWLSEIYRLTTFFLEPGKIDPSQWWETITGEPPENRLSQPKAGTLQDEGPYKGGHLVLTVQPDRADLIFFPAFNKQTGTPFFEELKPYRSRISIILEIAENWFKISPPLSRIAFGAGLDIPVADRSTGYRELVKYLPSVQIDPDHSTDLLYQINRMRMSNKIPELPLNRLTKWGVAKAELNQITVRNSSQEFLVSKNSHIFVHLEVDINTALEYQKQIPRGKYLPVFTELVDLATEIADKGDIP